MHLQISESISAFLKWTKGTYDSVETHRIELAVLLGRDGLDIVDIRTNERVGMLMLDSTSGVQKGRDEQRQQTEEQVPEGREQRRIVRRADGGRVVQPLQTGWDALREEEVALKLNNNHSLSLEMMLEEKFELYSNGTILRKNSKFNMRQGLKFGYGHLIWDADTVEYTSCSCSRVQCFKPY